MRTMLLFAALLAMMSSEVRGADSRLKECAKSLALIKGVPPRLPRQLHNEYEGSALVGFIVTIEGKVASPAIVSSNWRAVGRGGETSIGYDEAILVAVSKWTYQQPLAPCRKEERIRLSFGEKPIGVAPDR